MAANPPADLVPAAGDRNLQYITNGDVTNVHLNVVASISIGEVPTAQQICNETHRLLQIQRAQERSGGVSLPAGDYCDAIVRHHKVISASSEIGNFGLLTTMQQIQEQLNRIETRVNVTDARVGRIEGRVERIEERVNVTDARVERIEERVNVTDARVERIEERVNMTDARAAANSARFINYLQFADNTPFALVVKYTPGHPWVGAPDVDNVQFAPEYAINTPPPANLVPLTNEELQEMNAAANLAIVRRRLRGIFWFYNDQRLALPPNANRAACCRVIQALDHFLKYP